MTLRKDAGTRAVHVSLEMIQEFLHGRTRTAVPMNVPEDMTVFGSTRVTHQPNTVVFLCQSKEWSRDRDFTPDGEHTLFEPIYSRIQINDRT